MFGSWVLLSFLVSSFCRTLPPPSHPPRNIIWLRIRRFIMAEQSSRSLIVLKIPLDRSLSPLIVRRRRTLTLTTGSRGFLRHIFIRRAVEGLSFVRLGRAGLSSGGWSGKPSSGPILFSFTPRLLLSFSASGAWPPPPTNTFFGIRGTLATCPLGSVRSPYLLFKLFSPEKFFSLETKPSSLHRLFFTY